jgi:hypothetical protein
VIACIGAEKSQTRDLVLTTLALLSLLSCTAIQFHAIMSNPPRQKELSTDDFIEFTKVKNIFPYATTLCAQISKSCPPPIDLEVRGSPHMGVPA